MQIQSVMLALKTSVMLALKTLCNYVGFIQPVSLLQWQIHNQRRRELSDMSKEGLVGRAEVAQHMLCWQNLLTAQSLELADLINSLDEEAAAEIRKVALICEPRTHTCTHARTYEGWEPAGTSRLCRILFRFCKNCVNAFLWAI